MGQHNSNCKLLRDRFRCPHCNKGYMIEHHRNNHQKWCEERREAIERNPQRYKR